MSMVIPERIERKYEPYPEYKNSGIEWLGEIPAHWEVKKLKYVAEIITGNTPPKSDPENYDELEGLPWIKPDNLGTFLPVSESQEYLSAKGATLARIVPKEAILTCCIGSIGSIGITGCALSTNQQINSVVFSGQRVHHKYGFYMVYASLPEYRKLANLNVVAIINSQSQKTIPIPLPPLPEQQAIADFLDRETARIDELIARKQRLIDLLKEQRTALITRTVTKGLNQNVHMKDSGVEWLGEIPSHWGVKKLKYVADVEMGQSPSSEDYSYDNQGIPFLQGNADFTELYPQAIVWCDTANKTAAIGDILLSVRAPIGAVNIADQVYGIGRGLCAIQGSNMCQKYLYYTTLCLNKELNSLGTGSTYTAVSVDQVENVVILIPSNKEQQAIADYLDKETSRIDTLVDRIIQAIEKLQEYRSALITAAVTGKIDVRQQVS